MRKSIVLGLLFVSTALFAQVSRQLYQADEFPAAPEQCQPLAEQLGNRIHAATGLTIYRAEGFVEDNGRCELDVYYLADRELKIISTQPENVAYMLSDVFNYSSLAECNSELASQTAVFESATGLTPLVAYCYSTNLYLEGAVYILRIDALGMPRMMPQYFAIPRAGALQEQVDADIVKALRDQGAVVARVGRMRYPQYELERDALFYYSPADLVLETLDPNDYEANYVLTYATDAECLSEIPQARAAAQALGGELAAAACVRYPQNTRLVTAVTAKGLRINKIFERQAEYGSLAECNADRDRMIQVERSLGRDARAAMCTWYDELLQDHFTMAVYAR